MAVQILADGLHFAEGPRWHQGKLWFSDFYDHAVKTVDLDGRVFDGILAAGDFAFQRDAGGSLVRSESWTAARIASPAATASTENELSSGSAVRPCHRRAASAATRWPVSGSWRAEHVLQVGARLAPRRKPRHRAQLPPAGVHTATNSRCCAVPCTGCQPGAPASPC